MRCSLLLVASGGSPARRCEHLSRRPQRVPERASRREGRRGPFDTSHLGDEHPELDVLHIYHDQPKKPFTEALCFSHTVFGPYIAGETTGCEPTPLCEMFVDQDFDYSYTALRFGNAEERAAAADLFGWNESPWQDGPAFMASYQEFLVWRAQHPTRSREELALGAARLVVELVDPMRETDPRITDARTLSFIADYLRAALAAIDRGMGVAASEDSEHSETPSEGR